MIASLLKRRHRPLSAASLAVALFIGAASATAQQPAPAPTPKAAKPAAAAQPKAATKPEGGDAALRQRIEHLEEQLVDMQVVVGTLESFAKSGGASSASQTYRAGGTGDAPAADNGRVLGLENQVKNLTSQVQQLSEQVRALGGQPRRAEATPAPVAPPLAAAPANTGFSTATAPAEPAPIAADPSPGATPSSAGETGNPRQLYETAYGYLLQQDYGAAETAFDDFLKRFPNDNLSGNAQFWLGESFFVRAQYKSAAAAFLKGYQTYGRSAKAPDSLLKLAMSMSRMGQKDAACASFGELNTRFPASSADVKARAIAEKQRTGCP